MLSRRFQLCLTLALALGASRAQAADTPDDKAVQQTLKTLVNSIRYSKDDKAAEQLAYEDMCKALFSDSWKTMSPTDQKEAVSNLEVLLRKMAFPKGREMFQYLDAVLYDPVKVDNGQARIKSTVVIHRDVKKSEIPIEWSLVKVSGKWKVVDTVTMGDSTTQAIREDQVQPLLKEGGVPAVLEAMRKKVKEVQKS